MICLDRAGLVGEDGPTHHGAFDIAALRPIPNLTIASPMDETELRKMMFTAQLPDKGTFVIRYPRGRGSVVDWRCPLEEIAVGKGRCLHEGTDVAVLSFGPLGVEVEKVIDDVSLSVAHYTIEDGSREGGFGSAVLEWMSDHGYTPQIKRLGLPDKFVEHGTVAELQKITGIDAESIKKAVEGTL